MLATEQLAEALTLLFGLRKNLQDKAENYSLKLEYGAESDENRELREYFCNLAAQVQQVELALQGPHHLPSPDNFTHDPDPVVFSKFERANPDSVVRERA